MYRKDGKGLDIKLIKIKWREHDGSMHQKEKNKD